MKKVLAALLLFAASGVAHAQMSGARVASGSCGSPAPYPALSTSLGSPAWLMVDANYELCVAGNFSASLAGTTSNASSGVATSSTNIATVAYNYGFNGTTWDQLQVDGSKNLKVNVVTGVSGGTVASPSIVGGSLAGTGTVEPMTNFGFLFDISSSSVIAADLASPPNLAITGSAVAAWTGMTPGGTAASTQYAGDVNVAAIGGKTTLLGAGVVANTPRVGVAQDATTIAGAPPGRTLNTVAASVTNYVLSSTQGGASGAAGDYLSHCVIIPGTTSPGSFTILDNATTIYSFVGGASSVTSLISWPVPVGAISVSGGWKITTTTNITGYCVGKFT